MVADPRGWVDRCGAVFYVESVRDNPRDAHPQERGFSGGSHAEVQGDDKAAVQATTVPTDVLDLSSRPGSARTLYLDFTGDTTTGTAWNRSYGVTTISSPAYFINDPADPLFDAQERAAIHLAWRSVAQDFAPFDINVTTREPSAGAITRTSLADQTYGARVVITGSNQLAAACSCGGLAYLDVFDDVG